MRMRKKSNLEPRLESCKGVIAVCKSTSIYRKPESERYEIVDLENLFASQEQEIREIEQRNSQEDDFG